MENKLTSVERDLVIKYLVNGNSPLIFSVPDQPKNNFAKSLPLVFKAEMVKVFDKGIIILDESEQKLSDYEGLKVKFNFYFNKIGLYFFAVLVRSANSSLYAVRIPPEIYREKDLDSSSAVKERNVKAVIFYQSVRKSNRVNIVCKIKNGYGLFKKSSWNERISQFLSEYEEQILAVSGRKNPPYVIYLDAKKLVFASDSGEMILQSENEYAVELSFPIEGPVKERKISATFYVKNIIKSESGKKLCAICDFTSLKEEDNRYLSDFASSAV